MGEREAFREAQREHTSALARVGKQTLIAIARRLPERIHSDHLTALGFVSLAGVGWSYWYAQTSRAGLALATVFLILNWLGDSLDGTLARVRGRLRPRYGFYVDHVLDACGAVFVFAGLGLSGFMSERVAVVLLIAYFLLSIEVYLATYTVGKFHLSFLIFGPTELRLLLIAGNVALWNRPWVLIGAHRFLLFDVGGVIGIAGITAAFLWSVVRHTRLLYQAERI